MVKPLLTLYEVLFSDFASKKVNSLLMPSFKIAIRMKGICMRGEYGIQFVHYWFLVIFLVGLL